MVYLITIGYVAIVLVLIRQLKMTFGCLIEPQIVALTSQADEMEPTSEADEMEPIGEQLTLAVEEARYEARNEALNGIDRIYSEAELAAKSFGYWEKRVFDAKSDEQRSDCYRNARNAHILLIRAAGDFVPDLAQVCNKDHHQR